MSLLECIAKIKRRKVMTGFADFAPVTFPLVDRWHRRPSSLDRPDRKNPLTFESYAELRDWFRGLVYAMMSRW
jgi:hypothetical protein